MGYALQGTLTACNMSGEANALVMGARPRGLEALSGFFDRRLCDALLGNAVRYFFAVFCGFFENDSKEIISVAGRRYRNLCNRLRFPFGEYRTALPAGATCK